MLPRADAQRIASDYDATDLTVAVIGSHSAVDVCDGAADEGLRTLVIAAEGREKTYNTYFKAHRDKAGNRTRGIVDDCWVLPHFRHVLDADRLDALQKANAIMVPNRSFTSYCPIDAVENDFKIPIFGTRSMLRVEERTESRDYYWLLEKAGLPFPEKITDPDDINELAIIKLHHAQKKLERGFFTASSPEEYREKSAELIESGVITAHDLGEARIERYVIGPVFNFNFFYSPLAESDESPVELLGVDWRFESSLDGHVRLPAQQQLKLAKHQAIPEMTVVGHNSATLRESLLEDVYAMAEKFVIASKEHYEGGIIGPFCLQTCVDKDMNFYIYDVAPRVGGGTNVHMSVGHPYGNALWRKPVSTGRRIAMEIRRGAEEGRLAELVT